ncbi:hypothetical protein FOZ61_008083 [Perkinsus olseni]|uniref:HAT C-terminal dimerisation domain-containing protein n=1 Tax=Perkinsus olseni TaxID=32597 RepID=A0A7J6L681_PEROL|nr:hypothetical protein FOZ61_008083 [Perkinsus olseni]
MAEALDLSVDFTSYFNRYHRRLRRALPASDEEKERHFITNVYEPMHDACLSSLRERFEDTRKLVNTFASLWEYPGMSDDQIKVCAEALADAYPDHIDRKSLSAEISVARTCLPEYSSDPLSLINGMEAMELTTSFTELTKACRIFLSIPATVAGAERTFSKLSLVKNRLRNSSGQDRTSDLILLAVERDLVSTLSSEGVERMIDDFAQRKSRRAPIIAPAQCRPSK